MERIKVLFFMILVMMTFSATSVSFGDITLEWVRQVGSYSWDSNNDLAVSNTGEIFVSGNTRGSLAGPNAGDMDAYWAKYDNLGNQLDAKLLGASGYDGSGSVALDGSNNIYISGATKNSLGAPHAGQFDIMVAKYNSAGNLQWVGQQGLSGDDASDDIAVDSAGNSYVVGRTSGKLGNTYAGGTDAVVSKFDTNGNLLWTTQLGSSGSERTYAVDLDGFGNVYISGSTSGNLAAPNFGGGDLFVSKLNVSGDIAWVTQLGTSGSDNAFGVATDLSGNVYITGYAGGQLGSSYAGGYDSFLGKLTPDGNVNWIEQFGTAGREEGRAVIVGNDGKVYVTGITNGSLDGPSNGSNDFFIRQYDDVGNLLHFGQFGTTGSDESWGIGVDALGNIFTCGDTTGNFGALNAGDRDMFLAMLQIPEPTPQPILIDIKPGNEQNPVNLGAKGLLKVAILGSDTLDVKDIDQSSLSLEGASPQEKGNGNGNNVYKDVNDDGFKDLVLWFDIEDIDVDGSVEELVLTGQLIGGETLAGSDSILSVPGADANLDGVIDLADLNAWKCNSFSPAGWAEGDFDGDGDADIADLNLWKATRFTSYSVSGLADIAAIPEPATLAMLAVGTLGLLRQGSARVLRRRRR